MADCCNPKRATTSPSATNPLETINYFPRDCAIFLIINPWHLNPTRFEITRISTPITGIYILVSRKHTLKVLIPQARIEQRLDELAEEISTRYHDRPLTLLGVMTGSLLFLADLMKRLRVPHQVGVIQASSYPGNATTPGELKCNLEFLPPLRQRDVLLIDDILDTGQTLQALVGQLELHQPASLRTAVLLWKRERTRTTLQPDFLGFPIDDHFVVGYGLDYDDNYRHLTDIHLVEFTPAPPPR